MGGIADFIENKYVLEDLEYLPELNGCNFSSLERVYQRRLLETSFTIKVIGGNVSYNYKTSILKRIEHYNK
jgi:hypothetical protein